MSYERVTRSLTAPLITIGRGEFRVRRAGGSIVLEPLAGLSQRRTGSVGTTTIMLREPVPRALEETTVYTKR